MQSETTHGADALPSRSVSQWERAILVQWFAGTERTGPLAVSAAYVSERSQDDPKLRNMIVIAGQQRTDIVYLIHRPVGENAWVLTCGRTHAELGRFRTLPDVLSTIRRPDGGSSPFASASRFGSQDPLTGATRGR